MVHMYHEENIYLIKLNIQRGYFFRVFSVKFGVSFSQMRLLSLTVLNYDQMYKF